MEELPLSTDDFSKYYDSFKILLAQYGVKVIMALIVLFIGLRIIKAVTNGLKKGMEKRNVDASLRPFLISLIDILFKLILLISVISMLGVETTSFVAVLGAAGLAVGLALSGTLQNFAGGVLILILKPFKVGDFIEAQGFMGTVSAIQVFATIMKTVDNKTVIIPNGPLSTGALTNFSTEPQRRVDMKFGISYGASIDQAKEIIEGMIAADERILKDPAHTVVVSELANSAVIITVRVWANAGDYWDIYFNFHENVKKNFDKAGVGIPFPQMDVHLHNN